MRKTFGDSDLLREIGAAAAEFAGGLTIYAKHLGTGEEVGIDADAVMPTASVIKVAIMAELYRQSEAGEIDLDRRVAVQTEDWMGGTGILKELQPGLEPTVRDLCRLMICLSDNVATKIIVRLIGKTKVNASLNEWGLPGTRLIMEMRLGENEIRRYAVSTARELGRLMEMIATDQLVSSTACVAMREHLSRQQHLEQIVRGLPYSPYLAEIGLTQPVQVMNKIGNYLGMRADVAIVDALGQRFVLVTINDGSPDWGFGIDQEGNVLNGRIGRIVFDHWIPADELALAMTAMAGQKPQ